MIAAISLLLLGAASPVAVPVAIPVPHHVLDPGQRSVAVEAGDTVVVRLPEAGSAAWRRAGPLPDLVIPRGATDGTLQSLRGARLRVFAFQLRAAGHADLRFTRPGVPPDALSFRIVSR